MIVSSSENPKNLTVTFIGQSLAREFGPKGIHVAHTILDGLIETPSIVSRFGPAKAEGTVRFFLAHDRSYTYIDASIISANGYCRYCRCLCIPFRAKEVLLDSR